MAMMILDGRGCETKSAKRKKKYFNDKIHYVVVKLFRDLLFISCYFSISSLLLMLSLDFNILGGDVGKFLQHFVSDTFENSHSLNGIHLHTLKISFYNFLVGGL